MQELDEITWKDIARQTAVPPLWLVKTMMPILISAVGGYSVNSKGETALNYPMLTYVVTYGVVYGVQRA